MPLFCKCDIKLLHIEPFVKSKDIGRQRIFEAQVQVRASTKALSVGTVEIFEFGLLLDDREEMLANFQALRIALKVFLYAR